MFSHLKAPRGDTLRRSLRAIGVTSVTLALVASFALFIWPTPYRAIGVSSSTPGIFAAREHRLTGRVELLTRNGWRVAGGDYLDEYRASRP